MEEIPVASRLLPLLKSLRCTAERLTDKSSRVQNQAEYATAVQLIESCTLTMSEDEWRTSVSSGLVSELMTFAVKSVVEHPLSCIAVRSWASAIDVLLTRTNPSVSASHHVPQLWGVAKRLARGSNNANGTALSATLTVLRAILCRCPASVDCTPRHHLPHPVKTVDLGARLAALELLPCFVLLQPQQHCHAEAGRQQGGSDARPSQQPGLAAPWLEYLRKAVNCVVPEVQAKAVETICALLKGGVVLEAAQMTALLDMMLHLAESDKTSVRLQNNVGTVIGCLLARTQRGGDWTHFAATNAVDSARIVGRLFQPLTMTHVTQHVLSVAVVELLLQTVSIQWMGAAVARLFELLQPVQHDDRLYMPTIVSSAVVLWASRMNSDVRRVALVKELARFLDLSCDKVVTHTALLCLVGVIRMTVVTSEYASFIWGQLLQIPTRHSSLIQVASEAMACLAERSKMCDRALLLGLYTASGEMEFEKPLPPVVALHAKALLAMPAEFLRRQCVLGILLAFVASLSIEVPPPKLEYNVLRRVEYFNRFVLLLLEHQSGQLSSSTVASIKTSVRIFLSLLVSNPTTTSLYTRAASSACAVLVKLGASDVELKLLVALLEILDAFNGGIGSTGQSVRVAAYKLISETPWSACFDRIDRRVLIARALEDVAGANREGVPCPVTVAGDEREDADRVELDQLLNVAPEFWNDCHRLLPTKAQGVQAHATQSAVCLILKCCMGSAETENVQLVFSRLREWRAAVDEDPAVTAWNTLCCLNGLFGQCGGNGVGWVGEAAAEWFAFVELHWLSSGVWGVRSAAAKFLARLAALTGRRDDFTSAAVKKYGVNADVNLLSGVMLTLGEMHSDDDSATAPMATSFVVGVLRQHGVCGNMTIVVSAIAAMIRMVPRHMELVSAVVSTVVVPQLLTPATETTTLNPLVLMCLLKLFSVILDKVPVTKDVAVSVCVKGVIYAALSCRELSEEATCAVLNIVHSILNHLEQSTMGATGAECDSAPLVHPAVVRREVLKLLGNDACTGDLSLREAANVLVACWRLADSVGAPFESLLRFASRIDAAASPETRDAWARMTRYVALRVDHRHMERCQREMELIMRGKPAQVFDAGDTRHDVTRKSDFAGEEEWLSSSMKKSNGTNNSSTAGEEKEEATTDVASKLAVLKLMTEIMRHPEKYENFGPGSVAFERFLHLLFGSVSMAEMVPNFVRPATEALLVIVEKYGRCVKGVSTPFLLPWKVMLVNGMRSVIQHSVFCFEECCVLVEKFIECNLADDSSVRRVVQALATLLEALERCNTDYDAVGHGGCGRVVLTLSACCTRAAQEGWMQAEECASNVIASPSGQAAAALLCNQLVTSITVAHGFEPTHDMVPTPLEEFKCTNPAAALYVLNHMCGAGHALGPTVRHAAGCLLSLLLCTPGVPLRSMRGVIPFLTAKHQEVMMSTALGLLLQEGDEALSNEDAEEVLEILVATTCEKSRKHVESLLLAMASHSRPCVGSLTTLRLALEASCGVEYVNVVLHHLHVDVLLASGEPTTTTTVYVQKLSMEEWRDVAFASVSGFLLLQLTNPTREQWRKPLKGPNVSEAALSRLAEALTQTADPLALLQRVFPNMHEDTSLCGAIFALCVSARRPELRQLWLPCVQHALLSVIHTETLLREGHGPLVEERVSLFIRGLLMLMPSSSSSSADMRGAVEVVHSNHPEVCAVLTQRLMRDYVGELKCVIRSLGEREAAALRGLMQFYGSNAVSHTAPAKTEAQSQKDRTTTMIPERLTINVASFTQS